MIHFEWLLLMQIIMGILMVVFLRKLTQMKKQVDTITKEVTNYISYITEEIQGEELEAEHQEKQLVIAQKNIEKTSQAEVQNRLIQAVLQEYF